MKVQSARRTRWRRWLLRAAGLCFGLVLLALASVLVLLHSLDRAWLKQRLVALALTSSGLEISYEAAEIRGWAELDVHDLVVRSPASLRGVAPELLRIAHLHLSWWRVPPFWWRPAVREIGIDGLTLNVVLDEHGKTSFDAIPSAGAPKPATPRSQLAGELLSAGWPIHELRVNGITLVLIQTNHGVAIERDTARGLSLVLSAKPHLSGARLRLAIGDRAAPLELTLDRSRPGAGDTSAVLRASLLVDATAADASVALDLRVTRQNLLPQIAIDGLLQLQANAQFQPAAERIQLAISRLAIADQIASNEGALELPDHGSLLLRRATGDVDLARLLRLASPWLPRLELEAGRLHYAIDDLPLDGPRATTAIVLDGELSGARLPLAAGSLALTNARLSLHAQPKDATVAAQGSFALNGLLLDSGARQLRADDVAFQFAGQRADSGAITGQAEARFTTLSVQGQDPVVARNGRVALSARELRADPSSPLDATGGLSLDAELAALELGSGLRCIVSNLKGHVETPLSVAKHWSLSSVWHAEQLRVTRGGRTLAGLPVQLELTLKELSPDLERPQNSTGGMHVALEAGALTAKLDATKQGDRIDYALSGRVSDLSALRPFISAGPAQLAPWDKMTLELEAKGRLLHVASASPELEQKSRLRLTGAVLETVALRVLTLDLRSHGSAVRHDAELDLGLEGLRVADVVLGDEHLQASVQLDRSLPSLRATLTSDQLAKTELRASAAFDREQQSISYEASAQLSRLSRLAPLLARVRALAGLDLSKLGLRFEAHGGLQGVLSSARANGTSLSLAPDPLRSAKLSSEVELKVADFRWAEADRALASSAATLRATLEAEAGVRSIHSDLAADQIDFGLGRRRVRVTGLHDRSQLTSTGPLSDATLELVQQASIRTVEQNFAPRYPVGDLQAKVHVLREPDGLIKVEDVQLENRAAGSTLRVQGGLDLGDDLRRISLRATLKQDLARACNRRELFSGSGQARISLSVESPDFRVFHSQARLELENAHIHLPNAKVALDGIDGDVPIVADLTYGRNGIELLRGVEGNPYAMLRFADQHPLLKHRSFIAIAEIATPLVSIAPFAANLKVEQNIVSLSQLEMGVRGGSITGDGVFDWDGAESTLRVDVRASGVKSSQGEPFDGNAALLVDFGDRSIDGRADILRIGKRHLQDLLELQDPLHTNSGINHIRSALNFGYPKRVRIAFKHGFASAGVSFGGLAGLVSVDDVRGIPIGPLMERVMSSFDPEAD